METRKIVLVGNTAEKQQFIRDLNITKTSGYKQSIGVDLSSVTVDYTDYKIHYQLWDLSHQPRFLSNSANMVRGADAVIFLNADTQQKMHYLEIIGKLEAKPILVSYNHSTPFDCLKEATHKPKADDTPEVTEVLEVLELEEFDERKEEFTKYSING